jgi:predicted dehydrogenase
MALPIAIIGLGRIAFLLEDDPLREKPCTHTGAILANPACTLAGGMDVDAQRRALFAGRFGAPVFENAGELVRAVKPAIVCVATHPDTHERYCRLAAACGVPLVICEKPMAHTLAAAAAIRALAEKGGTKILINHERRYAADYLRMRRLLEQGAAGRICGVRATLYMGKTRPLVDALWHDGTHLVDAIGFLCGDTLKHKGVFPRGAMRARGGAETVYLHGELERQRAPVVIEAGAGRDHLVFEITVSCERGRFTIGNGVYEVAASADAPYARGFRSLRTTESGFFEQTGYFANMLEDAVACVQDSARVPRSSAACAFAVIRYLHSISPWKSRRGRFRISDFGL